MILLLSLRAGLRAGEIAGVEWEMVLGPTGRVDATLSVPDRDAKWGGGRCIPLHPELRSALQALARDSPTSGLVIQSRRGGSIRPNSVVNWLVALYAEIGAQGYIEGDSDAQRRFVCAF